MKNQIMGFFAISLIIAILIGGFVAMSIVFKADQMVSPVFDEGRFEVVEHVETQDYTEWYIVVDTETGVEYIFIYAGGVRTVCPLYNSDGTVRVRKVG